MIVVRVNYRDGKTKEMKFSTKEDMSKYIADNLFHIRDFKILNDGRLIVEFKTIDGKTITRATDCTDILEGILDCLDQAELKQERVKNIHFTRPKKEENNEDCDK